MGRTRAVLNHENTKVTTVAKNVPEDTETIVFLCVLLSSAVKISGPFAIAAVDTCGRPYANGAVTRLRSPYQRWRMHIRVVEPVSALERGTFALVSP